MFFQKDIETMSRKQLEELQLERLKWTVDYCYKNVPFYTKKLDEAGVTADKIKSLDDEALTKYAKLLYMHKPHHKGGNSHVYAFD